MTIEAKACKDLIAVAGVLAVLAVLAGCARSPAPETAGASAAPIEVRLAGGERIDFDRWDALALWLDEHRAGPVAIRLAPGDFDAARTLAMPSHSRLEGAGEGVTRIIARRELEAVIANRELEQGNAFITVDRLTVDCASRAQEGILKRRVAALRLDAITVTGCRRTGVRVSGRGEITRGAVLTAINAIDNPGDGIMIMWGTRNARYSNLYAARNGGTGIVIDHSEGTASNLISDGNHGSGVFVRNVFSVTISNLRATRNGGHGVLVQGFVASAGSAWTALNNGVSRPGQFDEIHFSGAGDLSYGVTDRSVIDGIVAGAYEHGTGSPTARHGVYVAPEISGLHRGGLVFLDVLDQPLVPAGEASTGP